MSTPKEAKTNIRVPEKKYELLKDIKDETGKSINTLIIEGIDLILLEYEPTLDKAINKAKQKDEMVKTVLSEIKKQRSE